MKKLLTLCVLSGLMLTGCNTKQNEEININVREVIAEQDTREDVLSYFKDEFVACSGTQITNDTTLFYALDRGYYSSTVSHKEMGLGDGIIYGTTVSPKTNLQMKVYALETSDVDKLKNNFVYRHASMFYKLFDNGSKIQNADTIKDIVDLDSMFVSGHCSVIDTGSYDDVFSTMSILRYFLTLEDTYIQLPYVVLFVEQGDVAYVVEAYDSLVIDNAIKSPISLKEYSMDESLPKAIKAFSDDNSVEYSEFLAGCVELNKLSIEFEDIVLSNVKRLFFTDIKNSKEYFPIVTEDGTTLGRIADSLSDDVIILTDEPVTATVHNVVGKFRCATVEGNLDAVKEEVSEKLSTDVYKYLLCYYWTKDKVILDTCFADSIHVWFSEVSDNVLKVNVTYEDGDNGISTIDIPLVYYILNTKYDDKFILVSGSNYNDSMVTENYLFFGIQDDDIANPNPDKLRNDIIASYSERQENIGILRETYKNDLKEVSYGCEEIIKVISIY